MTAQDRGSVNNARSQTAPTFSSVRANAALQFFKPVQDDVDVRPRRCGGGRLRGDGIDHDEFFSIRQDVVIPVVENLNKAPNGQVLVTGEARRRHRNADGFDSCVALTSIKSIKQLTS